MRPAHFLLPVVVLLALWLFTRGMDGEFGRLEGPRAMDSVEVANHAELEVDGREERSEAQRVAVPIDEVPASSEAPAPDAVRLRLARHSSYWGTAPSLGRVVAWATRGDRRGVEVVVTGVNADDWVEVRVPAPAGGADRVWAVCDEPGWTSTLASAAVGSKQLVYLQLRPQTGACLVGELVDARGRPERRGEVSLVPNGNGLTTRAQVFDGSFRVRIEAQGTYDLFARGHGGQARQVLELDPAQPPASLVVVLEGAGSIRGRLLDARGNGLADWPLVAATEGGWLDRLRLPIPPPSVEEDDDLAPGRPWTGAISGANGTFELSGLRVGVFAVASGYDAPTVRNEVLATGLVPSVDGLELRAPVAWTTIEVTDERERSLRFDPHERPGTPVKPGAPETDVYVELAKHAWRNEGTRDEPRWSVAVEAGVALRAVVWAPDRRLTVAELAATPTPPETWTLRAAPLTETAWLRVRTTGITGPERYELGFTVFDLASRVPVDRDVFRGDESVEVGIPPGCYEVRIQPERNRRYNYVPSPALWSGEVTLEAGEERTLEAAMTRRGRLELGWKFAGSSTAGGSVERKDELIRRLSMIGALEVQVTPSPGVTAESQSVTLLQNASLDLVPGLWTLTASGEDGRSASAVVEIEAGETTTLDLEVSLPR